jgi:hypothetical protein
MTAISIAMTTPNRAGQITDRCARIELGVSVKNN